MKLLLFALPLFVAAVGALVAQPSPVFLEGHPYAVRTAEHVCSHAYTAIAQRAAEQQSFVIRRPYDVLSYSVAMDWTDPLSTTATTGMARQYKATNSIHLRIDSADVNTLQFDAQTMRIDGIAINGTTVATVQPIDGIMTISSPSVFAIGEELTVAITYTHTGTEDTGFHLYAKGSHSGSVAERLAYTLGAPDYARYWMPCNDNAYDKARADFHIAVPEGFTVACNGLLDSITTITPTHQRIYHWSDTAQIATYLMVVHASVYREFSDTYTRQDGSGTNVPILYYVWEQDYDGTGYNAKEKFEPVPDMMRHFSSQYGEYPFSKYGMAVAQPFTYYAMENQTMTTLVREAINSESTIAHELSHQWLGDLVSPATWNDIWMNEGGATFSEAVWAEATSAGADGYKNAMADKRGAYLAGNATGTKQPPCYREIDNNPIGNNVYNYATTYAKGGWVYHMLRRLLGDDVFFPALRYFFTTYAYRSAETADMQASFEQYLVQNNIAPTVSMQTFFDQWVYKKGHPIYEATVATEQEGANIKATVILKQTQPTQVFTMPLKLAFVGANSQMAVQSMMASEREQQATFQLDFQPTRVIIDPDDDILCTKKEGVVTDVPNREHGNGTTRIFPNPSSGGDIQLWLSLPNPTYLTAEVYNTLGTRVAELYNGSMPAGHSYLTWKTEGNPSGAYFLRIHRGTHTETRTLFITQ